MSKYFTRIETSFVIVSLSSMRSKTILDVGAGARGREEQNGDKHRYRHLWLKKAEASKRYCEYYLDRRLKNPIKSEINEHSGSNNY